MPLRGEPPPSSTGSRIQPDSRAARTNYSSGDTQIMVNHTQHDHPSATPSARLHGSRRAMAAKTDGELRSPITASGGAFLLLPPPLAGSWLSPPSTLSPCASTPPTSSAAEFLGGGVPGNLRSWDPASLRGISAAANCLNRICGGSGGLPPSAGWPRGCSSGVGPGFRCVFARRGCSSDSRCENRLSIRGAPASNANGSDQCLNARGTPASRFARVSKVRQLCVNSHVRPVPASSRQNPRAQVIAISKPSCGQQSRCASICRPRCDCQSLARSHACG